MQNTLIALVENKPGVLNRIASLFRRRNFNIESLNVGQTDNMFRTSRVFQSTKIKIVILSMALIEHSKCESLLSS